MSLKRLLWLVDGMLCVWRFVFLRREWENPSGEGCQDYILPLPQLARSCSPASISFLSGRCLSFAALIGTWHLACL